jgi:hypothetical protein
MKHSPELQKMMHEKKRKGDTLSKPHAKAKGGVLQSLLDDMMGLDADKVKGLKKVTVASDSPKGLEEGLDKAKDMLGESEMMADSEEGSEQESEESPEMEVAEHEGEEESLEEKDEKIAELEAKIAKLEEKLNKLV